MLDHLRRLLAALAAALVRRLGPRAYLWLAGLFTLFIVADLGVFHLVKTMESQLFDLLVSHRVVHAGPDPEIVVVDIDEASLADLGRDFGRWPWPNRVLGEVVAGIEAQRPRAIVFDILFSDADVSRPDSDAYFNQVVAGTADSYFPMLRLGPASDALSRIRPSMLPGVRPLPGASPRDAPIALILPQVPAAIANGRLGVHNIDPDSDSVIRRSPVYLAHAGWRLPALATRIAEDAGWPVPAEAEFLLNWRGAPFSYRYVSFADVFRDLQRKARQRPAGEFAGKIVVIGSTAPSLFDIKASPMARIHPGVEILATGIDNLKHGDWLRRQPAWLTLACSLLFIWGMALALARHVHVSTFDTVFTVLQACFIAIAYASLNFTDTYIDMAAPMTLGLAYFSIAKLYAGQSRQWLANSQRHALDARPAGSAWVTVLTVRLDAARPAELRRLKGEISRLVAASPLEPARIGGLIDDPGLIQNLFADTALIYWLGEEERAAAFVEDARHTRRRLLASQPALAPRLHFHLESAQLNWQHPQGWRQTLRSTLLAALQDTPTTAQGTTRT